MDPKRFDALSRSLAQPASRRRAFGLLGAGGLLLGLRQEPALAADGDVICVYAFDATIDVGPSSTVAQTNAAAGELTFTVAANGAIDSGKLTFPDGTVWAAVGQADDRAISLRFSVPNTGAFIAVGVGRHAISSCPSAMAGPASGPLKHDAGSWTATLKATPAEPSSTAAATGATIAQPTAATDSGGSGATATDVPTAEPTAPPVAPTKPGTGAGHVTGCEYHCDDGGTADPTSCGCVCNPGLTSCAYAPNADPGTITQVFCKDRLNDPENCGICGAGCDVAILGLETNICVNGFCDVQCSDSRFVTCSPDAVCKTNLLSDTAHCGACDTPCSSISVACVNGVCSDQCLGPYVTCSPDAVCKTNLAADTLHCGSCGNACPGAHPLCSNSACTCQPGYDSCIPGEPCGTNLASDPTNCGACHTVCGGATPQCENGACVCDEPCANGTHMNAECTFCVA